MDNRAETSNEDVCDTTPSIEVTKEVIEENLTQPTELNKYSAELGSDLEVAPGNQPDNLELPNSTVTNLVNGVDVTNTSNSAMELAPELQQLMLWNHWPIPMDLCLPIFR